MKSIKHLFFFCLLLTVSIIAKATVYSGYCGANGGNLKWSLDTSTGVLNISGEGRMRDYNTNLNAPWYPFRATIHSVQIEEGVTGIGAYSFFQCSKIANIEISNSVASIENGAFLECRSLISVTIPNSVASIGDEAFWGCSSLTSIEIPNSVMSIGDEAFCNCI